VGSLHLEIHNPEHTERIIFLNPLASNYSVWTTFTSILKQYYEVVIIDYPGYGKSEYEPIKSVELLSNRLLEEFQKLEEKPTHLIGYSFGSWVAQNLAISNVINIKSLSLIGSSAHVYQLGIFMADSWLEILNTCGIESMLKQLAYWSFHPLTFQRNPEILEVYVRQSKKGLNNIDALKDQINAIANYRESVSLNDIKVPTLIIRGKDDISYPYFCSEELLDSIRDTKYFEVENSAHSTLWEQPKKVIKLITSFLEELDENVVNL
jgi:pimeloyl-ACP methyl ester carboxylesterase